MLKFSYWKVTPHSHFLLFAKNYNEIQYKKQQKKTKWNHITSNFILFNSMLNLDLILIGINRSTNAKG